MSCGGVSPAEPDDVDLDDELRRLHGTRRKAGQFLVLLVMKKIADEGASGMHRALTRP